MIFDCENGNIILRGKNIFVDANGGGQDGQFTVIAERIADIKHLIFVFKVKKSQSSATKDMI